MPEAATTPAVDATQEAAPNGVIAGKFADQAAFESGFRELAAKTGSKMADNLIGKGGQFETLDEGVAAYQAMERILSRKGTQIVADTQEADQPDKPGDQDTPDSGPSDGMGLEIPEPQPLAEDANLDDFVRSAGLDPAEIGQHFQQHGDISDEQYDQLKKHYPGIPKGVFKQTIAALQIAGQQQRAAIRTNAVAIAGGEDQLEALLDFAGTHYDQATRSALTKQLNDPQTYENALARIRLDRQVKVGSTNDTGQATGQSSGDTGDLIPAKERAAFARAISKNPSPGLVERYRRHRAAGGPVLARL